MRKSSQLSILLLAILFGSTYGQKTISTINPIDARFGLIDSIVIEYFDDVSPILYSVTFNRDSISLNSSSPFIPARVVKDGDTIKMLINYVNDLFISGKEKSVINITYGASLNFGPTDKIAIMLFREKANYWTHEIFLERSNGKIEFSKKFKSFIKFLRSLIKYNQ